MRVTVFVLLFGWLATPGVAGEQSRACQGVRVAGTFSNLEYNEEGGDLLGIEIKIVPVAGGRFQGAILVSEGEPREIVVVDITEKDCQVAFVVSAPTAELWSFDGVVSSDALRGKITYASGGTEELVLRRGCGYFDR